MSQTLTQEKIKSFDLWFEQLNIVFKQNGYKIVLLDKEKLHKFYVRNFTPNEAFALALVAKMGFKVLDNNQEGSARNDDKPIRPEENTTRDDSGGAIGGNTEDPHEPPDF